MTDASASRADPDRSPASRRRRVPVPLYEVGDLVLVREVYLDWLGKVIEVVPSDTGICAYSVRVTSRSQKTPAAGAVVQVPEIAMMLRRKRASSTV